MRLPETAPELAESQRSRLVWSMPCFVYVLGSFEPGRHWTYVGWTNDLDLRLARHNSGKGARSTRGRVWVLLHAEQHASRSEAMRREWNLKRDRTFRKRLVEAYRAGAKRAARPLRRRAGAGKMGS